MEYKTVSMTGYYFKLPGWFLMFAPIKVPYNRIFEEATSAGFKPTLNPEIGMIEKGAAFGKGWIAVPIASAEVESGKADPRVFKIEGEFKSYLHLGLYKEIGPVFKKIMNENPGTKEFYSCYLNSPKDVKPEELKTLIAFR